MHVNTHAWLKVMKSCLHAHVVSFDSPSPFSRFTRLRLLFLHGHFETNLTDALIHTFFPNFPGPKARVERTLHERRAVWLPGQVRPYHRLFAQGVRQEYFRG